MATTYAYKVRDRSGKVIAGSLDADNTALVANKLRQMGYVPISIDKKSGPGVKKEIKIPGLSNRVKLKEISVFSRQFATMINSGLTLMRSLSILSVQTSNPYFSGVIDGIRSDIESGLSLSQALNRRPKQFNRLYVAMVRAGETSGNLDRTLSDLATTIEKQVELRGKIRSALTYPCAVLGLVCCILAAMLLFIVPIFKNMYTSLGGKLPMATQVLIDASNLMVNAFPVLIVATIGGIYGYRRWVQTPGGKATRDRVILKVPVFGGLVRKTAMARFAGTLSTLLSSGVPVLESLEITADAVQNVVVANGVHAIAEGAKQGEPLTRPLAGHVVFPPMVTQMMAVGEETGALDTLLKKVANFYEDEVQRTVDALTSLAGTAPHRRAGRSRRRHGHLPLPAHVRHNQAGGQQQLNPTTSPQHAEFECTSPTGPDMPDLSAMVTGIGRKMLSLGLAAAAGAVRASVSFRRPAAPLPTPDRSFLARRPRPRRHCRSSPRSRQGSPTARTPRPSWPTPSSSARWASTPRR